ncbi:YccF domain-containing protein [Kitasatospora purpeofusca]|uniref:YccF domain-containing protein n=1 Tax=Kitasatospora purpeofusca TaxID=67352 RepID=UPI00224CFE33|nr:YccF domain-containing protein [Kitasatospora purpeofusca]MCX4753403.1 YccF domain-containing protein [Kitasatospora purpeofusca]WSR32907.1 YccF domain-containing protein [Kitasatospora purpeofusca]WSR41001.1 YccF domain-containing protein [Kitasatospora purpeofusca]
MKVIDFVLNVIWLIFCGIWMAIGYVIAGIICCVLIITFPFGIAAFRLAGFVIWPFGRTAVERPDAGAPSCVGNVIWLVFAGWWLALMHLVTSIPLFLSIIGIPFGWANLKLIPVSLMPLGREIVSTDEPWGGR